MLDSLKQAMLDKELRGKILFTLAILLLYRLGSYIPVPGVPFQGLVEAFEQTSGSALLFANLFSGGALASFSIFSLGIMPYITASIVMQLMRLVFPSVEKLMAEGETGQKRITQLTRYLTLVLALISAIGYLALFTNSYGLEFQAGWLGSVYVVYALIVLALVIGAAMLMWMGELITQRGVGNGMSLIIFTSIMSGIPQAIISSLTLSNDGIAITIAIIAVVLVCIPVIVYIERAQRRIPVQYARAAGQGRSFAQNSYIPLKLVTAGVIPIIFASVLLYFPAQIAAFFPDVEWLQVVGNALVSGPVNWIATFVLILFFSYFYSLTVFNPEQTADNLRKNGGAIKGVRPGAATEKYLHDTLVRLALPGGIFLAIIAVVPTILFQFTSNQLIQTFGGTSILIMVGVALDTMSKIESQLKQHNYDGFFK